MDVSTQKWLLLLPCKPGEKVFSFGWCLRQSLHLFRRISHTKNGFSLRKQRLSYTRALEMVRKLLKSIGLKPELYALHSMR